MVATHLIFLVEDLSTEIFLHALLPRWLPPEKTFEVHSFQGKNDLLGKLEARLRGYIAWMPNNWRIVVVVDRDDDDCRALKRQLQDIAEQAGLQTRSHANDTQWQIVNRIAIEELEAWYFGDWAGVRAAYPRTPASIPTRQRFRDPDAITGGTWEAFEQVMQQSGYFKGGLTKLEAARAIGNQIDPARSRSKSFQVFYKAIIEAMA